MMAVSICFIMGQAGCGSAKTGAYKTRSYVRVGKLLKSTSSPYVINLARGSKRLIFIGCNHVRDSTDRQFTMVERYFTELRPQIAFNEGGQIADSVRYKNRNEAAYKDGESGCLKYLCDNANIRMLNGDLGDSLEFRLTLARHPKDQLFLYYVMERVVIPYLNGAYGKRPFGELYDRAVEEWFVRPGFPLAQDERGVNYFNGLYQKYAGHPFELTLNKDIERFDYVNGGNCAFCAIGRTSKMVRDSVLLTKIDGALNQYDRVMVTFGHGHALALEPALKQIMSKKR